MLFLWVFGNNVEDRLGWALYLLFYVLAGIFATIGQVLLDPSSTVPVIGASGAIAGVMGAYLVWFPRAKIFTLFFAILVWFREIEGARRLVGLVRIAVHLQPRGRRRMDGARRRVRVRRGSRVHHAATRTPACGQRPVEPAESLPLRPVSTRTASTSAARSVATSVGRGSIFDRS